MKSTAKFGLLLVVVAMAGCAKAEIDVKPIEIKPIQLTIDVNIRISKEVDDSLTSLKAIRGVEDTPATAPAATPTN